MKLSNGERAVVDDEKLYGFLVNRAHPRQRGHADLFHRLLGIDETNAEILRDALLYAAATGDAEPGKSSPYGIKYDVRFQMTGLRGTYTILSVWIVVKNDDAPHLVTAFVE